MAAIDDIYYSQTIQFPS